MHGLDRLDNVLIGHMPIQDFISNAWTAGFDTKFDDLAFRIGQVTGDIVVEVVNMGVYHERNLRYFFILSAKFF
jgi:hypothetical protein